MSGNYNNIDYQALIIKTGTNIEPTSITYYGEARNAITTLPATVSPVTVTWTDAIDLNSHPVGSTFNVYIDGVTFNGDDPNGAQVVTVLTSTTGTIVEDLTGDTIGDIRFDLNFIYICVTDFPNGTAVWKTAPLSALA